MKEELNMKSLNFVFCKFHGTVNFFYFSDVKIKKSMRNIFDERRINLMAIMLELGSDVDKCFGCGKGLNANEVVGRYDDMILIAVRKYVGIIEMDYVGLGPFGTKNMDEWKEILDREIERRNLLWK